jgi:hypothetical protein
LTIAYVVSAYKLPEQLVRLVRRLATPNASFAIHVDRKTPTELYREMVANLHDVGSVRFLERHVCNWGDFGHVRATLKGIEQLLADAVPFDYLVLLSGQDYPLRAAAEIEQFLDGARGRSFMSHWPLPHDPWTGRGGLDRVERWHLVGRRHLHLSLPLRRRLPGGLAPFGGSPYWCLARPVVEHVHKVIHARPELVRFFERVFVPDELFFQTLVVNSRWRETLIADNLRYVDWSRRPAPAVLGRDDFDRLVGSGKLFARKFDPTVDAEVLDRLDAHVEQVTIFP